MADYLIHYGVKGMKWNKHLVSREKNVDGKGTVEKRGDGMYGQGNHNPIYGRTTSEYLGYTLEQQNNHIDFLRKHLGLNDFADGLESYIYGRPIHRKPSKVSKLAKKVSRSAVGKKAKKAATTVSRTKAVTKTKKAIEAIKLKLSGGKDLSKVKPNKKAKIQKI